MERNYWEKIAPAYNEEIFDVLHNDKKAIIRSTIESLASPTAAVIDIGCAIGKWLPVLSPAFKKVLAVDISARNLDIARNAYPQLRNVTYRRADMSSGTVSFPRADVAVCINAILTSSIQKRIHFFKNISTCLKKGGHLILVVPSLESWLMTRVIQKRWKIDAALFRNDLPAKEAARRYDNLQEGNVEIDNVPTKHYLEGELKLLLAQEKFITEDCRKIEYDWKTEFIDPPGWLKEPRPWDWMVLARKK